MNYFDEESGYYDDILEVTENRITELSRQLQTFLNNKKATIQVICCDFGNPPNLSSMTLIHKWEVELRLRIREYTNYLDKKVGPNEDLKLKFLCLAEETKSSPKSVHTKQFKEFLRNKIRLWQILHILSGLEIHRRPQLLKLVIKILNRLCHDEKELSEIIPDFFKQIQSNYQQLDKQFEQLCLVKYKEHEKNNKKRKVMVKA